LPCRNQVARLTNSYPAMACRQSWQYHCSFPSIVGLSYSAGDGRVAASGGNARQSPGPRAWRSPSGKDGGDDGDCASGGDGGGKTVLSAMAKQRRCQWRTDGSGRSAAVADEERLWVARHDGGDGFEFVWHCIT